ncbi:MAG TPA: trypsin-like peptidase domain-containing protein [Negativicutes bacterium]|nr:trypsin-like peptidase domain-containing protein [Negativicutes bacterium]
MLKQGKRTLQKPLWKFLAVALAFVVVAITSVLPIVAAAAESDIEAMKNSSVRVLITQGGRLLGKGSGFVIDDGKHIVTNYHVVEAVEKQGAQAWVALGRGRDMLRALEIRATSQANDIAVLSVDQKLAKPSVKMVRRDDIKTAEAVIAVGFPGTSDRVDEDWLNAPATPTPGQVVQKLRLGGGAHMVQITSDINPGNSGGPIFNSRGHVIGMSTLKGRSSSLNYAVDADEIMEVVKRTNAVAEMAPAAGASTGGKESAPVIEEKPVTPPAPEPFYQNPMIIGGAVVVLIILGIVGVMMSRKKSSPTPQMPMHPQMPQQQLPPGSPLGGPNPAVAAAVHRSTVTGVSGFFAGKTIEMSSGRPMIIGRDPQQAQLVFPSDMSEISRVHCIVTFDTASQTFTVEDRSTNGTFFVNGQKINGQARLRSGERFYLSEPTHLFELRAD